MKTVEIYTTQICGYCAAAKRLLKSKSVSFKEIDIMRDPSKRAEMMKRANGGRTVPQIFIGEKHVGGCDELHVLDRENKLDALLK